MVGNYEGKLAWVLVLVVCNNIWKLLLDQMPDAMRVIITCTWLSLLLPNAGHSKARGWMWQLV